METEPRLFRNKEAAFAGTTSPYLRADAEQREDFRARYVDGRRVVGLAWHTKDTRTERERSTDLAEFRRLLGRRDIRWVSLQFGDVDRFAAQVAAMDLVMSIDNSTAHIAGALGRSRLAAASVRRGLARDAGV